MPDIVQKHEYILETDDSQSGSQLDLIAKLNPKWPDHQNNSSSHQNIQIGFGQLRHSFNLLASFNLIEESKFEKKMQLVIKWSAKSQKVHIGDGMVAAT